MTSTPPETVESKRPLDIDFGTDVTLNVFPTEVSTSDWSGLETVLLQDLRDTSLYQDFSARNAAYVPLIQPVRIEDVTRSAVVPSEQASTSDAMPLDESLPEPTPVVPTPTEPTDEMATTTSSRSPFIYEGVFSVTTALYELAALSTTTLVADETSDVTQTEEPASLEVIEDSQEPVPLVVEEVVQDAPTSSAPITSADEELVEELPEETGSTFATTSTTTEDVDEVAESPATTTEQTFATTTSALVQSSETYEITLQNFDTPPLEPGQFVTAVQLRASIAAKLKAPANQDEIPYIEVLFRTASGTNSVGAVLLEDEISNAINGGYYLFALPEITTVDQLDDAEVVVRYHGDRNDLDGMFLDAAWIEIQTKVITEDDIKGRGKADKLTHLKAPELTSLVSDELNFKKNQAPLFNLRYNSQQNGLVKGLRSLFGANAVELEAVNVRHHSFGLLGIQPTVSVTKDGLITIEIPDTELTKLRPGSYEIELVLKEGRRVYTDTFNFQWGILAINPSKSEYEMGESTHFSIGALTPSGHTICEANLSLYITDPDGMVERVEVNQSGKCDGNNVTDVPDFSAQSVAGTPGEYDLYLERLSDTGEVLGFTTDTFLVTANQKLSITRVGPTRIYPPAPYPMSITVNAEQSFSGTLTERVPREFKISSTTADITISGNQQILTWNLSMLSGSSRTVSYQFDAPDISPYLFTVGPAELKANNGSVVAAQASTSSSTPISQQPRTYFAEHREWQIASDAVGNMILFFDGVSIPAGWTCLSCGSGTFFQRFVMGSSTYNTTGGAANHTHTYSTSLLANTAATMEGGGTGGPAINTHTHTMPTTITNGNNLPEYRQLQVIQYTAAAGEPTTIPAGAVAIFDVASSSLPANWNRYAAQDGRYVYGENTIGTTGGQNTHTHTISGTTGVSTGGTARSRGGGTQTTAATNNHTHTISTSTDSVSNEPPYIEVVLAQASADVSPTNGIIAMWTEDVDGGWIDLSSTPGDPFSNRFIKASTTYGATGGGSSHSHSNINGALTSIPSATVTGRTGTVGSDPNHQHSVNFTSFSTSDNLPPYLTAVFGKRQGTNPVYEQVSSRWYVNAATTTPQDPWPSGGTDLNEKEPITATSTPVKNGDEVRLRINVGVTNATSTTAASFQLQYAAGDTCGAGLNWFDVGDSSSTTALWRGYNNAGVSDETTLPSQLLASSTVSETYEEDGYASTSPNQIPADDYGEWDFTLEHNGAAAGTNYCFRLVEGDDTVFSNYSHYPRLYTNAAPVAPTLDKLFDNEKTASTTPWFYFVSTDDEGEKIHYQIQVDDNYDFGSTIVDRDTIDDSAQFENQVLNSDKAPFRQGEQIEFIPLTTFTNGTTYYWRVRGQDPDGSGDWGDWSTIYSFTIDTSLTATAWFQTQDEQFDTNTLTGVQTGGNEVDLISGSTTGTMISGPIDFTDGDRGTAWDSFTFNDTETAGDLNYQIEYLDGTDTWTLIPDADLSGNSTGFDASPISLLNLDTDTYTVIRIVADFTDSSGSPSLQDWTINWGYRVETPTIAKLFPNEQTGTTTPTFEFTTTDPQSDSLTYQVSWSTTPDFAASTTRTSDTAPTSSFKNINIGTDYDPFNSGDTIQYTIQPADVLTGTTTYWWRVRAKDTTGDNAYSFWTEPQSFTVIPGTDVSTWFQTTEEQFDTNILSGTQSLLTDAVTVATTASEAIIVYGEGTNSTPRYREWDGSSLGSEGQMLDIGAPVKWMEVQAGTTREEYVAVSIGTDADVNAQVFSTGAWGNLQEMTTSMGDINARGADVVYETLSGNAMVVFCDGGPDPSWYTWNGTSWNASGTVNLATGNDCEWVQLASDPTSNEIVMISRDTTGSQYEAQVWNGSTWANSTIQGGITDDAHEGMAVMYEESGDQAIIVTSDGNPARFRWNTWNGTTWGTAQTQTIGDDFEWGRMARDIGSDEVILCYQDEDSDAGVVRWTGSAWAGQTELDIDGNAKNDPGFDCVFEDSSGRDNYILTAISNTTQTNYYDWNNTTWSAGAQIDALGDAATMQLERTGDANILGVFFDDPNDALEFTTWDGSSWATSATMESNASVGSSPFGHPYDLAARNPGSEGTTIVSPGIDFDDGSGPYWREFSWNDSQPGTSELRYYVQYQTSTGSWAFIPDADLPDNGTGTTTGPFDLTGLNTSIYNVIRPYAELTCDGSGNCPVLNDWTVTWAGGITISGTAFQYDQTSSSTSGTVAVAVNGILQTGKTGTISNGNWSIGNVTVFPGDIVTVFVSGAADANEAVAVTRYDGTFDMDGVVLFERHVSLGSNDATTTPLTNADVGLYNVVNTEDVFLSLTGSVLEVCADTGCSDAELYIKSGTYYSPGGNVVTHDFENNGILTATTTIEVSGSWDNNATTTMTGSTVVFAATSTTESIDSTGASVSSFNNVTFGTTTGSGVWTLPTTLDVNGDLLVSRGTLARGTTSITIAGDLSTGVNGAWSGIGTTTFDGGSAANWSDASGGANVGYVVIDGTSKIVVLSSNVTSESITIGSNDTLDVSTNHYDITVYGDWNNQNNFVARSGEVFFAATSSGQTITTVGDAFYDLSFTGIGGAWSFTESSLLVNNDLTIATGTVNLPANGTTTIAGSFDSTGGSFAHNNGTLYFTSAGTETITFDGDLFTNVTRNLTFDGSGTWTITDTNATSTNDVRVTQGTVNFPSGVFAIGGTLIDAGGTFVGGSGATKFYSINPEVITAGGSSFGTVYFDGTGSWSFSDTNVDINGDLFVVQGTATLPSGTLTVGGSYINADTVNPGTGTVEFDSSTSGEIVNFGNSPLYNVVFDNQTGGWTIVAHATTTNNLSIATSSDWTLNANQSLSVGGVFTNSVGGASTTWSIGSVLSLESGSYSINTKSDNGDSYDTLRVAAAADVSVWNSDASTYTVDTSGSLYSQDHAGNNGDLYIWGTYENNDGNEYWSYATDFDGTDLTGSERQVDVRFAVLATASFGTTTLEILGTSTASTTIASQGGGTYTVDVLGGTTTAQYYEFADLGATGLSLLDGAAVTSLRDGSYTAAVGGGTAITLASTTIDANPAKQIFNVTFATNTAIAAFNVAQTDGTPTSYWWFRNGSGNLYGEGYDNDTGDPGSVRFDDSSLVITISGTVYDSALAPIMGGTCDGATAVIDVVVNGVLSTSVPCSNVDGSYTAPGVVVIGDPTLTIYLNNASGGERGSVVTRTPTGDLTGVDIYENRVIVRNEDTQPVTIANLAVFDNSNDTDLQFSAATTSNPDTLTVLAGNELFIATSSTFTPDGVVTLTANAGANSYDGTLYIASGATFNAYSTSTLTIGGRLELASTTSTFNAASTLVLMNATTSGKSITAPSEITFNDLDFNGASGEWNVGADIQVDGDMSVTNGTVMGTGDISIPTGNLTGNGVLSMGGGTTTIGSSNTLGGTTAWTFYNLQLGDGVIVGTTTPVFTSTTTISGRLTISAAHFFDAGATSWDLAGTGTVFVESGTFLEDTSTFRYSGNGSNVLSTQYYNLDINAGAGSPTYTATGLGIIVDNNLTVGGDAGTLFDLNTADPVLDINGDLIIRSNGTFNASDSATLTLAGSLDNSGSFTGNGGTITFDGTGTIGIALGGSSFSNAVVDATGDVTISEHATATVDFRLLNANSFTLASGESLAVGGNFLNDIGGAATTWTNTTLRLYGGADYLINTATTSDLYATLEVDGTTQARMWNSSASVYVVDTSASLYSQDHANTDGDLYVWGSYNKSTGNDYWNYATDFDGTDLSGGSERKVDVYIATSSSVTYTGGNFSAVGDASASTTIESMGAATYGLTIGGIASTTLRYYEVRDTNSSGLVFTGTPRVNSLSNGDFDMSQNGGTAITVGGSVITQNPAKNFNLNRFTLNAASGFNVTATGTSVSSWRFVNHYGGLDGEANDVDPDGDPGYIAWDDSAALITISGNVYSDEVSTVSGACDDSTPVVRLVVAGLSSASTSCSSATGAYSFSNVSYGSTDSLIVYLNGVSEKAAVVTKEPVSNINGLNLYENRVILRHENVNPIDIADMAVYDSSDDADIQFTAIDAGTDTLTVATDNKLIVWNNKEFEPVGNVTLTNGGSQSYGGSLQLYTGATWTGQGTESLTIGGSITLDSGAAFVASNGTTTFTTNGAGRTIDVNENDFNNLAFTGSGDWTISDATLSVGGHYTQSAGSVTLPSGTSTFSGSLTLSGGDFDSNGGLAIFDGASTQTITALGSAFADMQFSGGNYQMLDANATATDSVLIYSGDLTLPNGIFEIGGDFRNIGGTVTHNTSELEFTNVTAASVLASSSDLYTVTFSGGGAYTFEDENLTLLDTLLLSSGSMTLASGTLSIGGSFDASGGTFDNATGTILFNSADAGETIDPGSSAFYNVQFSAPTGGYTLTADATTTNNFQLLSASSFTAQSGVDLVVGGVFFNYVGGANTTWSGSSVYLNGSNAYSINGKSNNGDQYDTLTIGANSDIRVWNSAATSTTVDPTSSLYSQDHAANDGYLYIFGDFHIATITEYWSYATDFDGTDISGGSERSVLVSHQANATTTLDGGALQIIGVSGNETTITNQGSGTYGFEVSAGTLNAQYYDVRNIGVNGFNFSGTPVIASLSYGDFELAVNGGTLITLASTSLNANASKVITGMRFATTTAITGNNVTLVGSTSNAWTFTSHTGNLDGEDYDVDGATACGSIRWNDSSCLLVQQTNYRWRNDDGGAGAPDTEWYNASWDARKRVRVTNADSQPYTNAVVQIFVDYDSDMQADFDDLRFTDASGTTTIPFWIGSTTNSVAAEVWVEVPTLPAEDTATIFMYYNNPSAVSSSSVTDTFIAADDFEDGNITEYSGETGDFTVDGTFAFDGVYGLDATSNETGRTENGGIYTLAQSVSQGETIRVKQYLDPSESDETCVLFGIQSTGAPASNYGLCVDLNGTDRLVLVRNAVDSADTPPAATLDSANISINAGWYTFEIDWGTDDVIDVEMVDEFASSTAILSASDTNYSTGGFGFTFWFQHGGWDGFSSRPTLTTEPTVVFGAEQGDGGATWKAAENTAASYDVGDIARLRLSIENSGLDITNQQYRLEYADLGGSPSCEAVDPGDFQTVPVQASCGSSPICMQSSAFVTNGAATVDLLTSVNGTFTSGELRENPSNTTGNLNINQNFYTELEYVITPTLNVTDESMCFRVTNAGTELDTYLSVAQMTFQFDPIVSTIVINDGQPISLLPGATTTVYATGTVTDLNGVADLQLSTSTIYRSGVAGGASCSIDNNNCYVSTSNDFCSFTNCSGNTCDIECYADVYFHADPTDVGTYAGEEWVAFVEVEDTSGGYGFNSTASGVELNTLRAINVTNAIDYGALAPQTDTGAINASTSIYNLGNVEADVEILGSDLSDGISSTIASTYQKFATSTFNYSLCGATCNLLSSTTPTNLDVDLTKPTVDDPLVADYVYWGVAIPFGVNSAPHQGINVFTAISP